VTDFSGANAPQFTPYQLEQVRNQDVRNALKCPRCKRQGTVKPERSLISGFALRLFCQPPITDPATDGDGCGLLGVFEPDPELWIGLQPDKAIGILQSWLDGLNVSDLPDDAVSQLGALEHKDREIESLRTALVVLTRDQHEHYHREGPEDWQKCPYPSCREVRQRLGIADVP
jgi:hypothetical protein